MKGDIIVNEITFECFYEQGDCKYKNPANKNKCIGCIFSQVINNIPRKEKKENES